MSADDSQAQSEGPKSEPSSSPRDENFVFRRCLSVAFFSLTLLALVAFSVFVVLRFWTAPEWQFSIAAQSDVVSMVLEEKGETRWRVDGAVVCTRPAPAEMEGLIRLDGQALCGSPRWTASRVDSSETVLRLEGGSQAHIERTPAGGLALSIRAGEGESPTAMVESSDGRVRLTLPSRANLVWPPGGADGRASVDELVFPFTGSTTVGRDVGWSDARLLHGGTIAVYTADDSADERRKVDEAELMLGDQVRIGFATGDDREMGTADSRSDHLAKGFVRWNPSDDAPLDVVAFGRASGLVVDRFGESGYAFTPGFFIRILNDPIVIVLGFLLVNFFNLVMLFQPLTGVPGLLDTSGGTPRMRRTLVPGFVRRIAARVGGRMG